MSNQVTINLIADSKEARLQNPVLDQEENPLAFCKGNTVNFRCLCRDEGTIQDLTGSTVNVQIKYLDSASNINALLSRTSAGDFALTVNPTLAGWKSETEEHFQAIFTAAQTESIPSGAYRLCIWTTDDSTPAKIKTFLSSKITVVEDGC